MAREDCVDKGCRYIICCLDDTNRELPIGLVTDATLNSTEDTGATGSYLAGQVVPEQYLDDNITPDPAFVPDIDEMFQGDDGVWYALCSASAASCTHEMTLTGDYCFAKSGTTLLDEAARKLMCRATVTMVIKRHDKENNIIERLFIGEGRVTTKNRNFPGGQETNSNWSATIAMDSSTVQFLNGMH